ncbi:MAG: polymer-forming cytoskeletal protein [Erysipelotrichaceae bacterium]
MELDEINAINKEATVITKGVNIQGNINSDEDIILYGKVKGNLTSKRDVKIYGELEGNVTCVNCYANEASVHGDIRAAAHVELSSSSVIIGNIKADELVNGGRIKGNIDVNEKSSLKNASAIVGDIKTGNIEIEKGAIVQGNVMINQDVFFEEIDKL